MGEEITLSEIEKVLIKNHDKAAEGFYVTGHRLDEKIDQRNADIDYVLDFIDFFKASEGTKKIQIKHLIEQEQDGYHHKINIQAIGASKKPMHDITLNYFLINEEKEKKEKEELEGLIEQKDPFVFENKHAKHGILDARIVNNHEIASNLGAAIGYAVSLGNKDYAQFMGVRFALMAEKIFGKKE